MLVVKHTHRGYVRQQLDHYFGHEVLEADTRVIVRALKSEGHAANIVQAHEDVGECEDDHKDFET